MSVSQTCLFNYCDGPISSEKQPGYNYGMIILTIYFAYFVVNVSSGSKNQTTHNKTFPL